MIRCRTLVAIVTLCGCASDGIGQKATQPLAGLDPHDDLAAATDEAIPYTLVRRGSGAGASFTTMTLIQLTVKGFNGDTQFASARADVPSVLAPTPVVQLMGRGATSNHIELALTAKGTTIAEPLGYPHGSELKIWATQDGAGENQLVWDGPFVDHTGRGLAPLHVKPGEVDYYHWFLRANGEWWCEVRN